MQQHQRGLNSEFKREVEEPVLTPKQTDWEDVIPLELIRQHTKTDDVPSVTDAQLVLYRKAAMEAAQEYTGLLLKGQRIITEDIVPPMFHDYHRHQGMFFNHDLQYPVAQNFVWYYGLKSRAPEQVMVAPGSSTVRLPRKYDSFGLGCCNPCGDGSATARIMYVAGLSCVEDIPSAIPLGALKYIAHVMENPGDNVVATSLSGGSRSTGVGVGEASNPAWASGAIEIWRSAKRDAI